MSFYKLGIKHDLVYNLEEQNIITPTPIQTMAIPHILSGKDLIGEAQTGTGKTLAFLLPIFQKMDVYNPVTQSIIIAPTRELALQITGVAKGLNKYFDINILAVYGGQDVQAQLHKLESSTHLIISTPGRLLDHLKRGTINLKNINTLVIDEADEIIQIGFLEDIKEIMSYTNPQKQVLCFSATMKDSVQAFTNRYLNTPVTVTAPKEKIVLDKITQIVVETSNRRKFKDLLTVIKMNKPTKAIIFCRSRTGTDELYNEMLEQGLSVMPLHGGLTQSKREYTMEAFRNNEFIYLIATDVAARGIDVTNISHVFNYNLPDEPENYVHRIGRTGRAGKMGMAYTLLTQKDDNRLLKIEAFIDMTIERINYKPKEK